MVQCLVPGCLNNSSTPSMLDNLKTSFHQLPSNRERRMRWILKIRSWLKRGKNGEPWQPSSNDKICIHHFASDCFEDRVGKGGSRITRLLNINAEPTIQNPPRAAEIAKCTSQSQHEESMQEEPSKPIVQQKTPTTRNRDAARFKRLNLLRKENPSNHPQFTIVVVQKNNVTHDSHHVTKSEIFCTKLNYQECKNNKAAHFDKHSNADAISALLETALLLCDELQNKLCSVVDLLVILVVKTAICQPLEDLPVGSGEEQAEPGSDTQEPLDTVAGLTPQAMSDAVEESSGQAAPPNVENGLNEKINTVFKDFMKKKVFPVDQLDLMELEKDVMDVIRGGGGDSLSRNTAGQKRAAPPLEDVCCAKLQRLEQHCTFSPWGDLAAVNEPPEELLDWDPDMKLFDLLDLDNHANNCHYDNNDLMM